MGRTVLAPYTICTQTTSCALLWLNAPPVWPSGLLGFPPWLTLLLFSHGGICPQTTVLHHCSLAEPVISQASKVSINVCRNRCSTIRSCIESVFGHVLQMTTRPYRPLRTRLASFSPHLRSFGEIGCCFIPSTLRKNSRQLKWAAYSPPLPSKIADRYLLVAIGHVPRC